MDNESKYGNLEEKSPEEVKIYNNFDIIKEERENNSQ